MTLISSPSGPLTGRAPVPGDKSVSHRALMLGSQAVGVTHISGLLEGEDIFATADALRAMGVTVERRGAGQWQVTGVGVGGLAEPAAILDLGNSGTSTRLLMGLIAGHAMRATLTGDRSLTRRPMERVMAPLRLMGAHFDARAGGLLPLTMTGASDPLPIHYVSPVASAQVKSAVLLAGLNAPGATTVVEPAPTRDHTELMLRHFGARVDVVATPEGRAVTLVGRPELTAAPIIVPGDISSAAFVLVAALLTPGSDMVVENVGLNPLRSGILLCLREMGAQIQHLNPRRAGGEDVADLHVKAGPLRGITVPAARAPSMIDEYPVLAMAAAAAQGTTRFDGVAELRVKESDRLAAIARGLAAAGVDVAEQPDSLVIGGKGRATDIPGGCAVAADHDHRIAMSFLVLGLAAARPVRVSGAETVATSFPGFAELMNRLGGAIRPANQP
ncbi:MAG: 3-phosphoshikimate 1-carboxyvinyltransferase [Alphaproteobacteria bacterium]